MSQLPELPDSDEKPRLYYAHEMRAYVELAIANVKREQQWLPIESAPKDGTLIILGREESDECEGISTSGRWHEGYEDGVDYMGADSGFQDDECHIFHGGRSFGAESHRYPPNQPTKWMPLPQPPITASKGDGNG